MTRSLHRGAEADLTEAFRFYRREGGNGLAARFLKEIERVAKLLEEYPGLGTPTSNDRKSYPVSDFPYSIIYKVDPDGIRILVVRHQHRDPGYGDDRG